MEAENLLEQIGAVDYFAIAELIEKPGGGLKSIGEIIKTARLVKGYSLRVLAGKVGCAHSLIANLESGRRGVSAEALHEISRVLEINPVPLLFFSGKMDPGTLEIITRDPDLYLLVSALAHWWKNGVFSSDDGEKIVEFLQEREVRLIGN